MTVIGPNDPLAMKRSDPNLLHPEGDTLREQIDNMAQVLIDRLSDDDWSELAEALGTDLEED